jgi:hypothetical protein
MCDSRKASWKIFFKAQVKISRIYYSVSENLYRFKRSVKNFEISKNAYLGKRKMMKRTG